MGDFHFKFDVWQIKNGTVVTRPEQQDEDIRNASVFYATPEAVIKELQGAVDLLKAHYAKQAQSQKR